MLVVGSWKHVLGAAKHQLGTRKRMIGVGVTWGTAAHVFGHRETNCGDM